jgi:hypothetical protein
MALEEINSLGSHDAATVGVDIAFDFSRSAGAWKPCSTSPIQKARRNETCRHMTST